METRTLFEFEVVPERPHGNHATEDVIVWSQY